MTFATLRQHVLENCTLSTDWFGEEVAYVKRDGSQATLTVKIEAETKPKKIEGQTYANQKTDSTERIRVMISRNADFTGGGRFDQPLIGDKLLRSEDVDSDRRQFTFTGETLAMGPLHGVYIFERARRLRDARAD